MAATFRTITVDGEALECVEAASLSTLVSPSATDALERLLSFLSQFVQEHPEFMLARRIVGPRKFVDWLLLLATPTDFQRVHLEHVACSCCGGLFDIANPTVPDLYFGLPDMYSLLNKAWEVPKVPCPDCQSNLPRRAIWVAAGQKK